MSSPKTTAYLHVEIPIVRLSVAKYSTQKVLYVKHSVLTLEITSEIKRMFEKVRENFTSFMINMKMKRYEVNVRETALQPQEKQSEF